MENGIKIKRLISKLLLCLITTTATSFASIETINLNNENVLENVNKILSGKGWNPEINTIHLIRNINEYLMIERETLVNFDKLHAFLTLLVSKSPFREKGTTVADMALHIYNYHIKNVDVDNYQCQIANDTRCEFFPVRIRSFIEKKQLKFRALPKLLARGSNNYPGRELYPNGQLSQVGPEFLGLKLNIEKIPRKRSSVGDFEFSSYERWNVKLTTKDGQTVRLALPASDDFNYPHNFMPGLNPRDPEIRFYTAYTTVFMTAFLESGISIWKSEKNIKEWKLVIIYGKGYRQLFDYKSHLKPLNHPKATYPGEDGFNYRIFLDKNMKPYIETSGTYYWNVFEI